MKNQTPKTAPAAVELACMQYGALAQDLPRLPARTAHKGSARAIFWRYGPKAAGRSRRR